MYHPVQGLFIAYRLMYNWDSFGIGHWIGFTVLSVINYFAYSFVVDGAKHGTSFSYVTPKRYVLPVSSPQAHPSP